MARRGVPGARPVKTCEWLYEWNDNSSIVNTLSTSRLAARATLRATAASGLRIRAAGAGPGQPPGRGSADGITPGRRTGSRCPRRCWRRTASARRARPCRRRRTSFSARLDFCNRPENGRNCTTWGPGLLRPAWRGPGGGQPGPGGGQRGAARPPGHAWRRGGDAVAQRGCGTPSGSSALKARRVQQVRPVTS